ncbi:MAG: 30S ribosomal protein S3 [Candidatus Kerfeldbacteria bacterium]|nr:30S ribosomal protein S3 [Candidatus Kerfeldbacteria bacterium]
MGSKVNPRSFRTVTTYQLPSRWFASREIFAKNLRVDIGIRKLIQKKFRDGGVARIDIERALGEVKIIVHTSKPGVVIGRGGSLIEELKQEVKKKFFGSEKIKININIQEISDPDTTAELIYQGIRDQIEQRIPFRRAIKRSLENVMRGGALGCKIQISGRLNGADIARRETVSKGRLPLQKLRANIDYSRGVAQTVYGVIGIKVWVYKGDVFSEEDMQEQKPKPAKAPLRQKRSHLQTGGQKLILRKKADVEKEAVKKIEPAPIEKETK